MSVDAGADGPPLLLVGAGKGGVGKSTVAVNLALALSLQDMRIGVVDADLTGPNVPRMLNLTRRHDAASIRLWATPGRRQRVRPVERLGLQVMSAQFFMGEDQDLAVNSTFGSMLLNRLISDVEWADVDLLVVDLPPGTGDVLQALLSMPSVAGAVVVVTPQDVSHLDTRKLLRLLATAEVRILGGVENMSWLICPCCGERIELFTPTSEDRSIWSPGVTRLGQIPFSGAISDADHQGRPVVHNDPNSPIATAFSDLAKNVRAQMAEA